MGKIRTTLLALTVSLLGNIAAAAPVTCPHFQQLVVNEQLNKADSEESQKPGQQNQNLEVAENEKSDQQQETKTTKTAQKKSGASKFKGLFDSLIPSNLKNNSKK